jgi:hypothetical protein
VYPRDRVHARSLHRGQGPLRRLSPQPTVPESVQEAVHACTRGTMLPRQRRTRERKISKKNSIGSVGKDGISTNATNARFEVDPQAREWHEAMQNAVVTVVTVDPQRGGDNGNNGKNRKPQVQTRGGDNSNNGKNEASEGRACSLTWRRSRADRLMRRARLPTILHTRVVGATWWE